MHADHSPARRQTSAETRLGYMTVFCALALLFSLSAAAQQTPPAQPASATQTTQADASHPAAPDATHNPALPPATAAQAATPANPAPLPGEITEDDLKHMLVGKQLFLRGGYIENDLNFSETGMLIGHSPQGSYTLNEIQIERFISPSTRSSLKERATACTSSERWPTRSPPRPSSPSGSLPKRRS